MYSLTSSFNFCSPTTGKSTSLTVPSGFSTAASAIWKSRFVLPLTRLRSSSNSFSTLLSALAPILCTTRTKRSRRPSVISRSLHHNSAAIKVARVSFGCARSSLATSAAARLRYSLTRAVGSPAKRSGGRPTSLTRPSFFTSSSTASRLAWPGSALTHASTERRMVGSVESLNSTLSVAASVTSKVSILSKAIVRKPAEHGAAEELLVTVG